MFSLLFGDCRQRLASAVSKWLVGAEAETALRTVKGILLTVAWLVTRVYASEARAVAARELMASSSLALELGLTLAREPA